MNILIVTRRYPPAPGGLETQVEQIAVRLARRGNRVGVYTSDLYSDIPRRRLVDFYRTSANGVEVDRHMTLPIPWRKGTSFAPAAFLAIGDKHSWDIVHADGLNLFTVSIAIYRKRLRKCKIVCAPRVDFSLLSGRFQRLVVPRFDGMVALLEMEKKCMARLGLDDARIRVIPNGVDICAFRALPSREQFRSKFGITDRLILYSGRIDTPTKGCDVLVEAVSLAQKRIGPCTLVFAGPDWGSTEYLRALSQQRGVRTIFTENLCLDDLKMALVACDVFVLPSLNEGMPSSILEAMLCGAPVVATRVGGVPALVRDEETGLLVSAGDSRSLAGAICRIIMETSLSERLTANARILASKHSIDATVSQLERFYEALLRA
jgi:glycosyltransferase involved in cell wall biosynthesis